MNNLQKKLSVAVEKKIKILKNKTFVKDKLAINITSIGWNFVILLIIFIFIGNIVSKKYNNNLLFVLILIIGIYCSALNSYFYIKRIYFDKKNK